jgi:predicted nuclease of restriction endonuclease-like (RecB) superfamily
MMAKKGEVERSETSAQPATSFEGLLTEVRSVISTARSNIVRSADLIHVHACWAIGQNLVEFEQHGSERAEYGSRLLATVAERLSAEFGSGFDERTLRRMRAFYQAFPIRAALRPELSWTHYRDLLGVDDQEARSWYMNEAANLGWSTRALKRQISTLYYERLLTSQDKDPVRLEADNNLAELPIAPRDIIRDPVMLEFLGLPGSGKVLESQLESALIENLQSFLLELGKGFAFVARQQRISTETKDFYVDLVFYNYLLKCFVVFDLKAGELTHQDIGQIDMYVRMYDDLKRGPDDNPTIGIILCAQRDHSVVKYSVLAGNEQLFATKYRLVLPSEDELRAELEREQTAFQNRLESGPQ